MSTDDPRRRLRAEDLERILRDLACEESVPSISSQDLLDYAESSATESQIARVHHALAHSTQLRGDFLDYLRELRDFDLHAVEDAIGRDAGAPVPQLVDFDHPAPRLVRRGFGVPRWGWALAAAAVAVLLLRPWPAADRHDEFAGLPVLAAARGFEPEVVRGGSSQGAVDVLIPEGADRVQLAVWIPESWVDVPVSRISAAVVGDAGEDVPLRSVRYDFHDGDPALLLLLDSSWLNPGPLTIRLRADGPGPPTVDTVEARFRLGF